MSDTPHESPAPRPELMAAAERLRRHKERNRTEDSPYYHPALMWSFQIHADEDKLAAFVLPMLDETPVDEAFIRSICIDIGEDGLVVLNEDGDVVLNFVGTHDPHVWNAEIDDTCHRWPRDLKTRGDVRRLCWGLGIELKESPASLSR